MEAHDLGGSAEASEWTWKSSSLPFLRINFALALWLCDLFGFAILRLLLFAFFFFSVGIFSRVLVLWFAISSQLTRLDRV